MIYIKRMKFNKNLILIIGCDMILLCFIWVLSNALRFNFEIPPVSYEMMVKALPFIIAIKILNFFLFDLYRGMWRYTSIPDLINIIKASIVSSLVIVCCILFLTRFAGFSRSVFIIDWCLTMLLVSASRMWVRLFIKVFSGDPSIVYTLKNSWGVLKHKKHSAKNIVIIGAGYCGEKIFREISDNPNLNYNVVGFLDDEIKLKGKMIHGKPILGSIGDVIRISRRFSVDEIVIAVPFADAQQMRKIVSACEKSKIKSKIVPSMGELINGHVTINSIREVAYRDLLGRDPVRLDTDKIGFYLKERNIMVTGAGGSIGSELCRQICKFHPRTIILYERAESSLYEIELELKKKFSYVKIIPLLGDIRDRRQLSNAFEKYNPTVVFHAAAYKHVPMMEMQPWKAIKNNIFGTRNMVEIAKNFAVERFVFVSTDKAVRPTNVMGASKRCAELVVQGQNQIQGTKTHFMIVRFGNVVGSIGSVVPLFKKQIAEGGPVTVTHPEVTRYFMTIPEACQLILQAGTMGEGGEIFLLDMGKPIKIIDIARDLIKLSGFEPDKDIKIEFIGLRPGEKLYEELITDGEGIVPTKHEKIMVLRGDTCEQIALNGYIDELGKLAYDQDAQGIKKKLKQIIPEYIINNCNVQKINPKNDDIEFSKGKVVAFSKK